MTEAPEVQIAASVVLDRGDVVNCLSIDMLNVGALTVDVAGATILYPWHRVAAIGFYDDSAFGPVPTRHEGSE